MLLGIDLRKWRERNGHTQESLRIALGIKSRQTIITWEQSEKPLQTTLELALLALEHLPERCSLVAGVRATAAEYAEQRKRGPQLYASR